jgi:hypothetical protein
VLDQPITRYIDADVGDVKDREGDVEFVAIELEILY